MTPLWLQLALVTGGIILLVASLPPAAKIIKTSPSHTIGWKSLLVLIAFFTIGYLVYGFFLSQTQVGIVETIVTLVFFSGAVFVFIVIWMSHRTVQHTLEIAKREKYRALHDELTGLSNRTLMRERIDYTISMAKRESNPFSILLLDLDRFKEINDTLGHAYGDALLVQIAPRLRSIVRESDTVARLGGDEFAILLPGAGQTQATIVADKVAADLERPFEINGHSLTIGASIGICTYPTHGDNADTLLQHVDIAMYSAKRKDTINASYVIFESAQDKNTLENLTLMADLKQAIRSNQLVLHYQPKIKILDGRLYGVEALVRWAHPKLGAISPDKFIPMAEQCGQINMLTRWVLNMAFSQYQEWRTKGMSIPIAVNISCKDLRDPLFPQLLQDLLREWNVTASDVTLELTEGSMMDNTARIIDMISVLHDMGLKMSIDDFGTGYSSLFHLKRLPAPELKIDRSFVQDMINDENDAVIVRSTIDLAHNMGLKVTAEGVENRDILDLLAILGCDFAQGFYFAKPMPAVEIEAWLQTREAV